MNMSGLSATSLIPTTNVPDAKSPYMPHVGPYIMPEGIATVSEEEMANGPGRGEFHTRPYVGSSGRKATFDITTSQGDKVTLTYERTEFRMDYLRGGGGYVPDLPTFHNKDEFFSMEVQGDLDEQEQADLTAFRNAVEKAIEGFLSRDTVGSDAAENMDMAAYASLSEYAVALDAASSVSWASQMVKGVQPETADATEPSSPSRPLRTFPVQLPKETAPIRTATPAPTAEPTAPAQSDADQALRVHDATPEKQDDSKLTRLSELSRITETIFEEISSATASDAQRDALDTLSQKFSGLVEKLIHMFEEKEARKHNFDGWA